MKCFEEIFSGSIDCNWRNVSAEGLIAPTKLKKSPLQFLENGLYYIEYILEKCSKMRLNSGK